MAEDDPLCPVCVSGDCAISNIDGLVCQQCGAWFDRDDETGELLWGYMMLPPLVEKDNVP